MTTLATCVRCDLPAETLDICDACLRWMSHERIHYQRVADFMTQQGVCAWSVDRLMCDLLDREERRPDRCDRADRPLVT